MARVMRVRGKSAAVYTSSGLFFLWTMPPHMAIFPIRDWLFVSLNPIDGPFVTSVLPDLKQLVD